MARSAGEVQADIALTRRVIEQELEVLHGRLPKRWWLSYAWLAGGLVVGLLLSRAPLLSVMNQGLRLTQFGAGVMGTAAMIDRLVARSRQRQSRRPLQSFPRVASQRGDLLSEVRR